MDIALKLLVIIFIGGFLFAFGMLVIGFVKLLLKAKTSKEYIQDGKTLIKSVKKKVVNDTNILHSKWKKGVVGNADERLFAIANCEIENSAQKEGVWIKSLILADGNSDRQKIEYIKLRVEQMTQNDQLL
jgi:hypothetical protein